MTRQYSDSIALAAQNIVQSSGMDITQPVPILPLAKRLMQETGCGIDAAKRHVARAIRMARHELTTAPAWGGRRTPAGGRPAMNDEQKARERVAKSPKLQQYETTIFYDWPNWDEHMQWVATATVKEIVDWAEAVK